MGKTKIFTAALPGWKGKDGRMVFAVLRGARGRPNRALILTEERVNSWSPIPGKPGTYQVSLELPSDVVWAFYEGRLRYQGQSVDISVSEAYHPMAVIKFLEDELEIDRGR